MSEPNGGHPRRWSILAVLVLSLATLAPSFAYWAKHGRNHAVANRSPFETELYGLKFAQLVLRLRLAEVVDGGLEVTAVMGQRGRFQQDAPVEVGEEVAGAPLGAVDGDDAEVFRTDGLHAWDELTVGLLQDEGFAGLGVTSAARTWHDQLLSDRGMRNPEPKRQSGGQKPRIFLS